MFKTLLIAGAFACLSFGACAAEECEFAFEPTIAEFAAAGAPVVEVPASDLPKLVAEVEAVTGEEYGDVTRGFLVRVADVVLLGLEVDGCLLPPIVVDRLASDEQLSGRGKDGKTGA